MKHMTEAELAEGFCDVRTIKRIEKRETNGQREVVSVTEEVPKFNFKQGICLDGVHFVYPDAETETIRGVSVYIPAGKTVAIVGENGSGKTTLAKLIMGLYRPNKGNVIVGGINTKENNTSEIRKKIFCYISKFSKI